MPNVNRQTIYQMGNVVNDVVRQATGRDPVQAISMDYVTVEQNTLMGIETQSGAVVTFITPKSVPLLTLEAQIVAQQNLHGYDYPWPGGGGKNIFDVAHAPIYSRYISYTDSTSASYRYSADSSSYVIDVKPNTTYTIKAYDEESGNIFRVCTLNEDPAEAGTTNISSTNAYSSPTNRTCTITTASDEKWLAIQLQKALVDARETDIQVEEGTTATAFSPYSNICPITGFTGCNISVSGGDNPERIYPVEWETVAGTVYGGVLDAKNGKLIVDRALFHLTGTESGWAISENYVNRFSLTDPSHTNSGIASDNISNYLKSTAWGVDSYSFGLRATGAIFVTLDTTAEQLTVDDFKTFLSNNPLDICYKLTEPVEYDVVEVDINTLVGENVMSASTGDISLSYYVYHDLL